MKRNYVILALSALVLMSCQPKKSSEKLWNNPQKPLSVWMAESEMQRIPDGTYLDEMNGKLKWNYTSSIEMLAFMDLTTATGDERFWNYTKHYIDTMIDEKGVITSYKLSNYNIDHVCPGKMLFDMYERHGEARYKIAMDTLFSQLMSHPRTQDSGFWHKQVYPHQMWLDGLYMGAPYYAEYVHQFIPAEQQAAYFEDVARQFIVVGEHTYDPATQVYRHGWDESKSMFWCNPETGQSAHCWGRGLGWYVMGMIDALEFLPEGESRDQVVKIFQDIYLYTLPKYQDHKTKMWYQVLECPHRKGNYLESTGSIMFVYGFLKAIKLGVLDEKYTFKAMDWYRKFVDCFVKVNEDGTISITDCCAGAGLGGKQMRSGTFDYYINETVLRDNDNKAVGPFIWASLMYEELVAAGK
ncbi:MAG: glycoside hydrolase family 88 protein [Bacteroidales bacterium]|nr:glycoside hydrolase family 88 protein [Bacteroidales bacterium]MBO5977918.1 glycoside hydrolase family 88 protein [Bacteroidales bacterium]MBO7231710.1 glycoside hydrolase family 88 protein [Bacteroidales bacterium]